MADNANQLDVIIVGAGLSGLMAAHTLLRNGKQFVLLEAQNRVGGRILTKSMDRNQVELGAQFISPHQKRIKKLINEFGINTNKTFTAGNTLYAFGEKKAWTSGEFPPYSHFTIVDYLGLKTKLKQLLNNIDSQNPWKSIYAKELDTISMESWLEEAMSSQIGKEFYRVLFEEGLCVDLNKISVLDVLWDIKSTGSFEHFISAEEEWLTEGACKLPLKMAESITDKIKLENPVRQIIWTESTVQVLTDESRWYSKKVIIAIPPPLCNQVKFFPSLPTEKRALFSTSLGYVIKCIIVYDRPFWRDRGKSGLIFHSHGPVKQVLDISPPDQKEGRLTAFIIGDDAKRLGKLSKETQRHEIIGCIAELLGKEAQHPIAFYEKNWSNDTWTKGGYSAHFPLGTLSHYGAELIKPVGPIYWAGTETALEWRLYMEGALEAGERAALQVLNSLE